LGVHKVKKLGKSDRKMGFHFVVLEIFELWSHFVILCMVLEQVHKMKGTSLYLVLELIFPHGILHIKRFQIRSNLNVANRIKFIGKSGHIKEGNRNLYEMKKLIDRIKILSVVGLVDFLLELGLGSNKVPDGNRM
jgi:hypothetical protein